MSDFLSSWWSEIAARPDGPLAMRFYIQPAVAALLALRDGIRDARAGKPAWLWSVFTDREGRRELLATGWQSIGKVFLVAVALDLIYELVVRRGLQPLQTALVAVVLAIVPYALLRGPINRLARPWIAQSAQRTAPSH